MWAIQSIRARSATTNKTLLIPYIYIYIYRVGTSTRAPKFGMFEMLLSARGDEEREAPPLYTEVKDSSSI